MDVGPLITKVASSSIVVEIADHSWLMLEHHPD
jgi:hypothetical protein